MRGQNEVYQLPPIEEECKPAKVAKIDSRTNSSKETIEMLTSGSNMATGFKTATLRFPSSKASKGGALNNR